MVNEANEESNLWMVGSAIVDSGDEWVVVANCDESSPGQERRVCIAQESKPDDHHESF